MKTVRFTHEQNKVLSEIYRRLNYFHKGKVKEPLMYLAFPSEAKKIAKFNLIKPYNKETIRVLNWYSLTDRGRIFFANYTERVSERANSKLFNGEYVKQFNPGLL